MTADQITVVQAYTPDIKELAKDSTRSWSKYAKGHRYGYIVRELANTTGRAGNWIKVEVLSDVLATVPRDSWVFWADTDSFVLDDSQLLESWHACYQATTEKILTFIYMVPTQYLPVVRESEIVMTPLQVVRTAPRIYGGHFFIQACPETAAFFSGLLTNPLFDSPSLAVPLENYHGDDFAMTFLCQIDPSVRPLFRVVRQTSLRGFFYADASFNYRFQTDLFTQQKETLMSKSLRGHFIYHAVGAEKDKQFQKYLKAIP